MCSHPRPRWPATRQSSVAADIAPRLFPMLTTAAGTLRPAKAVVIGAGVAGLQAIATARRLGAQVEAYDIRAAAREQVESLGAKMIDTGVDAETEGGYARELTDDERAQQAEALARHLAKADVVVSTAAIPGRPAPKIITEAMVDDMKPGSVIVDLAAETGGNCELTRAGETVNHQGVLIHGPTNLPSRAPLHASEMYAKNITTCSPC
jgi:H+-translocating NAD(P) transhydrogenase subunit alpha